MADRFLKKEKLSGLVDAVRSKGGRFVAPVKEAKQAAYAPVSSAEEILSDYILPGNSYKEFLFPQTEVIAEFTMAGGGVALRSVEAEAPSTVIFGGRPCEAASLKALRSVFTWDFVDEFYTKREDAAVVLTVACTKGDAACFCTTVELSPESVEGSDVMLFEAGDESGWFAYAISEKGKKFLSDYASSFDKKPVESVKPKELFMPEKIKGIDLERISARLKDKAHYADALWPELARKCIGCGACTFSCPTCHCFDIIDEGTAFEGERRKNWDACQFDHFTLHAAGHNPRDTQYKRWRNRFMCKFNYYPEKFASKGCVGCGRCIRVCPVRLDITEVMEAFSK